MSNFRRDFRPTLDEESKFLDEKSEEKKDFLKNEGILGLLVFGVIALGASNRVAYKIMTEPMGNFSFFLGLFNAVFYTLVYGIILGTRMCCGIVPKEQVKYTWTHKYRDERGKTGCWGGIPPIKFFIIMGFMDGLGNITGLIAAPYISGPMISLMSQTIVLFSIICAVIILGTEYSYWQLWSAIIVLAGATLSLIPSINETVPSAPDQSQLFFSFVTAVSTLPNAISFTLKELVFKQREEEGLDLFIVNTHASLFQLVWQPVYLPIAVLLGSTGGMPILEYIQEGFQCFVGITPISEPDPTRCSIDPWPYFVYIGINLSFNILLLVVLKRASALLSFMAIKAILPFSVILFYIKWPLIGVETFHYETIAGLIIVLIGLVVYRYSTVMKKQYGLKCLSFYCPKKGDKEVGINS